MNRPTQRSGEEERARMAAEIHDELGGNLTAIKMALGGLMQKLPADTQLIEQAVYLESLVNRTIEATRRLAAGLGPSVLDSGLVAAIEGQAQQFRMQTGIACNLDIGSHIFTLADELTTTLFRIIQEALTNIARHAHASQVWVALVIDEYTVRLSVADNGCGVAGSDDYSDTASAPATPAGMGINNMKERARSLGGALTISGNAGGGTVVSVNVPRMMQ